MDSFQNGFFDPIANRTFITLIPKVENPIQISQYRPISLCNVSYRILTKFLVNRLRPMLNNLVGPHQSSFLKNRSTSDNIIVCQEVIHSLMKTKDTEGGMILKIDFEKAYDKISWVFLKQTLIDFDFPLSWVNLIMFCVSSPDISVIVIGEPTNEFKPKRGLRQGDPLSPYLFVLCMERLANMISNKVSDGSWRGIKASRGGPILSHLFFADDIILFAKASVDVGRVVMETLEDFCDVSGQSINFQKSLLFISPNVSRNRSNALHFLTHMPLTKDLGKYLGVPIMHKRVNKNACISILERTKKRLSGWKNRLLNFAARVTLVKHVTSSLPVHVMQTMPLPVSVCNSLDQMNRNFIWGDTENSKKVHLVS